jgi:hypothetical protein
MPLPIRSVRGLHDVAQRAPEAFDSVSVRPPAFLAGRLQVSVKLLEIGVEFIQLRLNPPVEVIESGLSVAVGFGLAHLNHRMVPGFFAVNGTKKQRACG